MSAMRKPFKDWNYGDAQTALGKRQNTGDKGSLAYVVEKDNWQDGAGWSGPQITGTSSVASALKDGINRDFTPKGATSSVVRRFRRGTVGRESNWTVTLKRPLEKVPTTGGELIDEQPTARETVLINQANDLLVDWWNYNKGLRVFRQAVSYCATVGRGPLRLYPPPGTMVNGQIPVLTPQDAVKQIYLLAPKPDQASVVTDTWNMQKAGVYTYEDAEGKPAMGLCYVDEQGMTVIKSLTAGSANTAIAPGLIQRAKDYFAPETDPQLDLNGNLLLFELDNEPLITESVKRQQKLLDKAGTVLSHEMDEDGFREKVYFNMMPPGKTVMIDDPDNPGNQIEAFVKGVPSMFERGPGKRMFAQGIPLYKRDATGNITDYTLTTPTSETTEPVPVDTFIKTAGFAYRNILEDTDQLHVLISGDAASSGESRKQARDDHTKSLEEMKSEVDYIGSSVLETVLGLIAIFTKQPGYFDGIRVSFDCRIDPGPLSSEDRKMNIEEVKAEIKSMEDARIYAGSNDPDALAEQIDKERKEKLKTTPVIAPAIPLPTVPPTNPAKPPNGNSQVLQ